MSKKIHFILTSAFGKRFPYRYWIAGCALVFIALSPDYPGDNRIALPFAEQARASGEEGSYEGYYEGAYDTAGETSDDLDPGEEPVSEFDQAGEAMAGGEDTTAEFDESDKLDSDGDGLSDEQEIFGVDIFVDMWFDDEAGYLNEATGAIGYWGVILVPVTTDPLNPDTDGDHLPDGWEVENGFNPADISDGSADGDQDGLSIGIEYEQGTNWLDPDTDGDGFLDGEEVLFLVTDPNDPNDPAPEPDPVPEPSPEPDPTPDPNSEPTPDPDPAPVPVPTDSDGDGFSDADEAAAGTNPNDPFDQPTSPTPSDPAATTPEIITSFMVSTKGVAGVGVDYPNYQDTGGVQIEVWVDTNMNGEVDEGEISIQSESAPVDYSEMIQLSWGVSAKPNQQGSESLPFDSPEQLIFASTASLADDAVSAFKDAVYKDPEVQLLQNVSASSSKVVSEEGPASVSAGWTKLYYAAQAPVQAETSVTCLIKVTSSPIDPDGNGAADGDFSSESWGTATFTIAEGQSEGSVVLGEGTLPGVSTAGNELRLEPAISNNRTRSISLVPVEIAVDGNRDGELLFDEEDRVTEQKPYRFWINDDTDDEEDTEGSSGAADSGNDTIDTKRDLEDFTRLAVKIGGFHDRFSSGDWQLGFKWTDAPSDPSAKIYLAADQDGSNDYLTDEAAATSQAFGQYKTALLTATKGTTTYMSPGALANLSAANPTVHFLVEGDGIGKGRLTAVFKINGQEHEAAGVWFDLRYIDSFYERVKATPEEPGDIDDPYTFNGVEGLDLPSMAFTSDQGIPFKPDPDETKDYIVLVHGWNTSYDAHITKAETFYKRLWHAGYKGRFSAFRWPTTAGITTFNEGDYRAWHSGKSLKQYIASLPSGYTKNIAAHSQGGVVLASAIREGLAANNCAFMQAAIPAMCFDGSIVHWSHTTPDTAPDAFTQNLGFKDKVPPSQNRLINCSLIGDPIAGDLWETNNKWLKPQPGTFYDYDYIPTNTSGQKLRLGFLVEVGRYVTDVHEALSFVTKSRSETLSVSSSTGGVIDETISLNDLGFKDADVGNPHSAQFWEPIQNVHEFYKKLFIELINQ